MADCKDDWIETGSRLSEEGWKLRRQRSDQRPVSETGNHHDHRIRSPFIEKIIQTLKGFMIIYFPDVHAIQYFNCVINYVAQSGCD